MKRNYDFSQATRGAVVAQATGKTRITIRIDDDVLDWFRDQADAGGGGNYQSMINEALRSHMAGAVESVEKVLRRVVREELKRAEKGPAKAA